MEGRGNFEGAPSWPAIDLPSSLEAPFAANRRVHFVGIGGIGMSGIAEVLATLGYAVSGSDLNRSEATDRLTEMGAQIAFGHDAANITSDTDVVVVSSAVDDSNPEVSEARAQRIPVIPRAEMLAELMRVKCGVAVAGAHGKTTTTSLVGSVLGRGGLDPTLVIGGRLKALGGTNARLGRSRYMVVEADESDGTFLLIKPTLAVVTNIDREHMAYYGTMDRLTNAYAEFINGIPFFGRAVVCTDCEHLRSLLGRIRKRHTTYGTSADCDFRAVEIDYDGFHSSFDVISRGVALGRVEIAMPGAHMVLNSLAAMVVGMEFGMTFEACRDALASFDGIMRRFEVKGERGGVLVVDDYGHHPTEIRATLAAARRGFSRRIVAVFQPHRYTRVYDLFNEFVRAFGDADEVIVTDVYAAGESAMEGIDGASIAQAIEACGTSARYVASGPGLAETVASALEAGDLLLTMGAGDITRLGPEVLARLGG